MSEMITSPQNEKLKLVRKLRERKHREREGLFVTEGEDLLEAGLAAGRRAAASLLSAAGLGARRRGGRAGAARPRSPRSARAPGRSPSGRSAGREPGGPRLRLPARRRRPRQRRRDRSAPPHALLGGVVVLGPGCADPFSPKAVRASMGSIFAQPPARAGIEATPAPRAALVAHGGEGLEALDGAATALPRRRARGPARRRCSRDCEATVTIPLRPGGAESLNVAAAAAIACERISSPAMPRRRASDA